MLIRVNLWPRLTVINTFDQIKIFNMKKGLLVLGVASLLLAACGKNASSNLSYESGVLGGTINGTAWESAFGRIEDDVFSDGFRVKIVDLAPTADSCWILSKLGGEIIFGVDRDELVTGVDHELSLLGDDSRTITFYDGETNYIVTTGKYRFDRIDTTNTNTISGKMVLSSGDEVQLNGDFELYYCK